MRVRWLRKALRNLDEEATCISVDDPAAAEQVVKRILDAVARLEDQPSLGRPGRVPGVACAPDSRSDCSVTAQRASFRCALRPDMYFVRVSRPDGFELPTHTSVSTPARGECVETMYRCC